MRTLLIILSLAILSACTGVEQSTGKVLENANSTMNGESVWWLPPEEQEEQNNPDQPVPDSLR